MTRTPSFMALSILLALSGACGDDDTSGTDSGTRADAGNGGTDAGNGGTDAGNGGTDAGNGGADGAVADAGDTDGGDTDGGAGTCPDLAPTQGDDNLIISQIDLENDRVEFYNPTDAAIDLDGLVLCQRPQYQTLWRQRASTVPAGGYAWLDDLVHGELRRDGRGRARSTYTRSTACTRTETTMMDFVCWRDENTGRNIARWLNGDGEVLWSGDRTIRRRHSPQTETTARRRMDGWTWRVEAPTSASIRSLSVNKPNALRVFSQGRFRTEQVLPGGVGTPLCLVLH